MRKIISFIVLTILIYSFCFFSYADNNTFVNNTASLQEQHKELKNQIESASSELKDVQEELSDNLQQVQEVDANIEVAQNELDEINIKYDILNKEILKNEAELKKAKESYEKEKGLFEERLVAMYEAGDTEYIDVLLQANGISDFLSSYYLLEELALYDTDIIDSLEKKKKAVEEIQETLNMQNKEMLDLQKNQIEKRRLHF